MSAIDDLFSQDLAAHRGCPAVTACSAVVTRYPTGCFGIDYQGCMFFWWGFVEVDVHAELERLRIPAKRVKWEERYYDRRYDFNDPRSYKTRPFIPKNVSPLAPADNQTPTP